MNRPITSRLHGMLDYTVGIALIAAPWLFGFTDIGGAPVIVPWAIGGGILAMSLMTDYELGVVHRIPLPLHLLMDVAAGIFLFATPFIWGSTDQGAGGWLPHVIVGALLVVDGLMTQPHPSDTWMREHHHHHHGHGARA